MAFYIYSNGKLLEHQFSYLDEQDSTQRIDPTLIPGSKKAHSPTKNPEAQFVLEAMSSQVCAIHGDCTLQKAYEIMQKKKVRHLPILDNQQVICGLISDRDLVKYWHHKNRAEVKVKEMMSSLLVCVHEETNLVDVASVLVKEKISSLVVVNDNHDASGLITASDILRAYVLNKVQRTN